VTREQAEANWIWDSVRGDIRPSEWPKKTRIRCTDKNIMEQQRLARLGTLIHTAAKTSCPRKSTKADSSYEGLAVATFIDNVNCLWCRKDYFAKEQP
jgi:hypothetical protein